MPVAIHAITDVHARADAGVDADAEARAGGGSSADADAEARASADRGDTRAEAGAARLDAPVALSVPRRNRSAAADAGATAGASSGSLNGPRAGAAARLGSTPLSRAGPARRNSNANDSTSTSTSEQAMTRVTGVINMWEIEDEWWRDEPIRRRYWRLRLETGQEVTVFEDLETACWFQQDY